MNEKANEGLSFQARVMHIYVATHQLFVHCKNWSSITFMGSDLNNHLSEQFWSWEPEKTLPRGNLSHPKLYVCHILICIINVQVVAQIRFDIKTTMQMLNKFYQHSEPR